MSIRVLGLEGVPNARDLGGYETIHGRKVATGRLFRSDALAPATDPDVDRLGQLRLSRVIDLRGLPEVELFGADRLPTLDAPEWVHLPVYEASLDVFAILERRQEKKQAALVSREQNMVDMYRWYVTGATARQSFGAALRHVATAECLPLLFHCSAGKDRTGWLAAIVLTALGVPRETVLADYLLTNELLLARLVGLIPKDGAVERVMPLLEASEVYLAAAFDEVERSYGGFDAFLRDGLGIDDTMLAALRGNLLS